MPTEELNTFHDESGLVTVGVFRSQSASKLSHHFDLAAEVPEDMVAIGGGGVAVEFPVGGLLTASYPNEDLSAWLVSSKDHHTADPHFLTAYAIGLRITGMSREQLLAAIHINTNESGLGEHPEATATLPARFLLVSGGFKVDWKTRPDSFGNLATASFPSTNLSWTGRSKDHEVASPANLRAYAIGLRGDLPVGRVEVAIERQTSSTSQHPSSVADVTPGFALTGGGAEAHWQTSGSLLWKLEPMTQTSNQEFRAGAKDHITAEPATITAYALGIKIHR